MVLHCGFREAAEEEPMPWQARKKLGESQLAGSVKYYIMRFDADSNTIYGIESGLAAERAMAQHGGTRMDLGQFRWERAILVLGDLT